MIKIVLVDIAIVRMNEKPVQFMVNNSSLFTFIFVMEIYLVEFFLQY